MPKFCKLVQLDLAYLPRILGAHGLLRRLDWWNQRLDMPASSKERATPPLSLDLFLNVLLKRIFRALLKTIDEGFGMFINLHLTAIMPIHQESMQLQHPPNPHRGWPTEESSHLLHRSPLESTSVSTASLPSYCLDLSLTLNVTGTGQPLRYLNQ